MAYSKTPQTSTYQTKDVSLLAEWESRDATATKDNDALNCFYEVIQNKKTGERDYDVIKREGTVAYGWTAPAAVRGIYYWRDQDKLFVATGTDISIVTASTGTLVTTLSTAFSTSSGEVGFCEFLFNTNNTKIVATDGTTAMTIDASNTKVVIVDGDMPTPHLPQPVFLDGYLFLVKSGTADIYNSNLNDPTVWTAGDFITAEMAADKIQRITNMNNYILVLGSGSIEYFFDAANASGSPLQRNDTPFKFTGYISGFAKWGNKILFIGQTANNAPEVFMAEDFKLEPIGTPPVRRGIEGYTTANAAVLSYGGHDFYHINTGSLSYQLDLKEKLWTRTAFKNTAYFPITASVNIPISGVGNQNLVVNASTATMYYFRPTVYQDDGTNFTMQVITDNQWFDSFNNKFCARLSIQGDRTSSSASFAVSWSDDDYQTYSTARDVDMSLEHPKLTALGRFRRRAFKLVWTQNFPMRIKNIELDLNMGQA
jgi:hypothetical protein